MSRPPSPSPLCLCECPLLSSQGVPSPGDHCCGFHLSCFREGNSEHLVMVNYYSSPDLKLSNMSDEVPNKVQRQMWGRTWDVWSLGHQALCWWLETQKSCWNVAWKKDTGFYLLSISLFSLQLSPTPGSDWVLWEGEKRRHSKKQSESAQGGQDTNYHTKGPEYIWMNNEENTSIFVLLEYLKFKITAVYTHNSIYYMC